MNMDNMRVDIEQMKSLKENSASFLRDDEPDSVWAEDIISLERVISIWEVCVKYGVKDAKALEYVLQTTSICKDS